MTKVWGLQVNQADLKYVNPAARAAAGGARTALGADYELKLRSEAGPMPGKLAKRKHQISSLYHHAKIMVMLLNLICSMVLVGSVRNGSLTLTSSFISQCMLRQAQGHGPVNIRDCSAALPTSACSTNKYASSSSCHVPEPGPTIHAYNLCCYAPWLVFT